MSTPEYQTTRIWKQTHTRLRKIAAATGESMVEALDRLTVEEMKKLQAKERKHDGK
jgi:hypothetical protein